MLKIHLHLKVVAKSTHEINDGRCKEFSCTLSSLRNNVASTLRAYLHIYFQSINAAFKTLMQLTFLLSELATLIIPGNQRHCKSTSSPTHASPPTPPALPHLEVLTKWTSICKLPPNISSNSKLVMIVKGPPNNRRWEMLHIKARIIKNKASTTIKFLVW